MKKRLWIASVAVGVLVVAAPAVVDGPSASATDDGTCGSLPTLIAITEKNDEGAFEIQNEGHLTFLSDSFEDESAGSDWREKDFVLTADIDLRNCDFTPIGNAAEPFTGTFDGGGFEVERLKVDVTDQAAGLFGVASGAEVKNLTLSAVDVTTVRDTSDNPADDVVFYAGAAIGHAQTGTTVTGVTVSSGSVSGPVSGGLVGRNEGTISTSSAASTLTAGSNADATDSFTAGGLVGQNDGTISDSSASGEVSSYREAAGGLVGRNTATGTISDSSASGNVSTEVRDNVGGFAGENFGSISGSSATGTVTSADDRAGGFVGDNAGTISDSRATGNATSTGTLDDSGDPDSDDAGGFAGRNRTDGTITNSTASGNAEADGDNVGGFVGENRGTVSGSAATGSATAGVLKAGGFVGWAQNATSTITDSSATGDATSGLDNAGAFAGTNDGTISGSSATGTATSGEDNAGGFVGWNLSTGTISSSDAEGSAISEDDRAGGFAGRNDGVISSSTAAGDATAAIDTAGGFVGRNSNEISDSSSTGDATAGGNHAGGFVGLMELDSEVTDSTALGNAVAAGREAGGFVGENKGTITGSRAEGSAEADNRAGGFAGVNYFVIEDSGAAGSATAETYRAGGFVGWNTDESETVTGKISSSLATGNASVGDTRAGGFAGVNQAEIIDSYSTGNATAARGSVGGFVGENRDSITSSYSTGRASGPEAVGGFVGFADTEDYTPTVVDSFWDVQTSGIRTSDGGTAKQTSQMISLATYNNTATVGLATAWGIIPAGAFSEPDGTSAEIWGIASSVNCGYPFLHWQTTSAHSCPVEPAVSSSPERQASSAAIHLDVQGGLGAPVAGVPVVMGGQGLAPGSTITVVVRSIPQTLASGTVSALGNFSTEAELPALPPGPHTVTLTGIGPDGSTLSLVQRFTVGSDGTIVSLDGPQGTRVGGLAATGPVDQLWAWGVGVVGLLLLGLALSMAKVGAVRRLSREGISSSH